MKKLFKSILSILFKYMLLKLSKISRIGKNNFQKILLKKLKIVKMTLAIAACILTD